MHLQSEEGQILCDSNFITFCKWQNYRDTKRQVAISDVGAGKGGWTYET